MTKLSRLIVVIVILVLAFILNPSPERHRDKIRQAIAERSQLERLLGIGEIASFASHYHSLGIASYTTVNDKMMSIGAFGIVFVAD